MDTSVRDPVAQALVIQEIRAAARECQITHAEQEKLDRIAGWHVCREDLSLQETPDDYQDADVLLERLRAGSDSSAEEPVELVSQTDMDLLTSHEAVTRSQAPSGQLRKQEEQGSEHPKCRRSVSPPHWDARDVNPGLRASRDYLQSQDIPEFADCEASPRASPTPQDPYLHQAAVTYEPGGAMDLPKNTTFRVSQVDEENFRALLSSPPSRYK
ncbi:hypothetical protein CYMTET_33694 [Cymbomonas tetramitiformis]|uniref:Uncharacterized protein n=1 Tax=Cymbomonas tetramitiformis TaxID=36881 RepID=A0AAE0FD68_9CHLO|nr:hypothetical protein CYMTET_33694 [Cymbomonas tetramitiformis]